MPNSLSELADPATLRSLLRLVLIIGTYLLFRPYVDQIFRRISGAPDTRQEQLKARLAAMHEEQEKAKRT
jgi:Protein trafficking PGA2